MRRLSLNQRLALDAQASDEIEVVLFRIDHPDLAAPIRLSTDNTEVLSEDPLIYCTRSTWSGADPATDPYLWIVASALLPSDLEDAPSAAQIALENLDSEMVELLTSFTAPATVDMAVVLASSPDTPEAEWAGLQILAADIDAGAITLSLSREEIEAEYFPTMRMNRDRFPGLHL